MRLFGWPGVQDGSRKKVRLDDAQGAEQIREAILGYLRIHRQWYHKWSRRYAVSWNTLTFLVLVLGALTSILTAIGNVDRTILITLPALSSLCAALLIQFRLRDGCRIRDHGRIAADLLICRALAIPTDDAASAMTTAIGLREAAHQIELDQLAQFMAEDPNSWRRETAGTESAPGAPGPASAGRPG